MGWRLWGYRLATVPALLYLSTVVVFGWRWGVAVAVLVAVAVGVANATGVLDAVMLHERAHRARCRIRSTFHVAVHGAGLDKQGVEPSIVGRIRLVDGGLFFRVRPAPGHDAAAWNNTTGPLCKWWKCAELEIRDHLDRRCRPTDLLDVSCSLAGILLRPVSWPYGAPEEPGWGRANLPIGHFSGGRPATLDLDETHLMVGGPPGSGKSTMLHTLLCSLALLRDEALVILDLKGVDLEPWRERSAAFCHQAEEARPILAWALGLMNGRYEIMREQGVAKWTPRPEAPHVTIVIDEYAELDPTAFAAWDRLARLGRAAGFSLVTCTQRPAAELGEWFTRIRTNSIARVAMGALGPDETGMVLGRQYVPKAFVTLPKGTGRLVNLTAEAHGRTFRAYWSERAVGEVAATSVGRRPALTMEPAATG